MKPEFWSDDKLGPLDPLTRLVFLGLVSQADDAGRLVDSPKRINGLLFPFTEEDCTPCLELLSTLGVISRGLTSNLQPVIQILGWSKHQRIEKPNIRAALPPLVPPSKRRQRVGESSGNDRGAVPDVSRWEGEGEVEGIGEGEGGDSIRARDGAAHDFDGYTPTAEQRTRAAEIRVDIDVAVRKWRAHRKANDRTPADLVADFDGWLENEPGYAHGPNGNGVHPDSTGHVSPPRFVPPPDDEPDVSPEERRAGLELVKQAVAATRSAPPTDPEIDDPQRIAQREANRIAQLQKIGSLKP